MIGKRSGLAVRFWLLGFGWWKLLSSRAGTRLLTAASAIGRRGCVSGTKISTKPERLDKGEIETAEITACYAEPTSTPLKAKATP